MQCFAGGSGAGEGIEGAGVGHEVGGGGGADGAEAVEEAEDEEDEGLALGAEADAAAGEDFECGLVEDAAEVEGGGGGEAGQGER